MENELLQSALLRKVRRDKGKEDIEFFLSYYLPHIQEKKTPDFHKEIFQMLLSENRLGIAAPRGFAKSTIVQFIYGIYCLLYNQGEDILTISQSSSLAEDWVRKIKMELENNERIKTDFGSILQWGEKESKRWTADHLLIQKDGQVYSQVRARGRGCQVRGLRPTKVICDDLENEELVRSQDQRRFLREWFLGALLNVLKPNQQLVVIGTILHPLALIAEIIEKKEQFSGWKTKKYKALENGIALWEEMFSVKDLEKRKFEIGTYRFEAEYQNNPITSDICLWRPEWIKKYQTLPDIKLKFVVLDPAISTRETADYSALTCFGKGTDGNFYEIESVKGRWGTWDLIKHCIDFYLKHRPIRFGIEEIAFQSVIRKVLTEEGRKRGVHIPVEAITLGKWTGKEKERRSSKDKYTRALAVIHLFEQGLVYLKTQDLIDQLILFPEGQEDDLVDSCVYNLMMFMKYAPIKVMVKNPTKQFNENIEIINNTIKPFCTVEDAMRPKRDWRLGG